MAIEQAFQRLWHATTALLSPATPRPASGPRRDYEDIRKVNTALLPLLALGFAAAAWLGWTANALAPVLLWCMACIAVGATVGFLFGIPRAGKEAGKPGKPAAAGDTAPPERVEGGRPNTNLEEVSDWLTKIIVGLTLVHLGTVESRVMAISRNAAASLRADPTAGDVSAATALVVGFAVVGFLGGYLYTRLFLQGAFVRSDSDMRRFQEVVAEELSNTSADAAPPSGEPSVPSPSDRQSAERILQMAPANRPDEVLAPLRALAADYENLRRELPFGAERTRKMSVVASGMKRLALAAAPFLPSLARSASPGERLAAVIILQMKFDPEYIEWLAGRLVEEPAFVGYQAASALLARARIVGGPERERIKTAVRAAKDRGIEPERERDKLVEQILAA